MMACLSVAVLAASLGRAGTLAAQNSDPAQSNDAFAQPSAANPETTEAEASSAIPEPRRFPSPLPAAALRPAGGTDSPYTIPAARGGVGANASLQQLEERVMAVQKLEKQINVLFPESRVFVIPLANRVIIKGDAVSAEEASRILQIAHSAMHKYFIEDPSASGPRLQQVSAEQQSDFIVNLLEFEQFSVAVNVTIAELDEKKMRGLGFDFSSISKGTDSTTERQPVTAESLGGLLQTSEADGLISGLVEAGIAKVLMKPTLTVKSGHAASFLTGGEIPMTTVVGVGGPVGSYHGTVSSILVKPSVIDEVYVKLEVTSEYSSPQSGGSIGGLPSIKVQRSTTTAKLREGQSFVLNSRRDTPVAPSTQAISFLEHLPFIGGTLRVKKVPTSKALLIIVTPTIKRIGDFTETHPSTELIAAESRPGGRYSDPFSPDAIGTGPSYYENQFSFLPPSTPPLRTKPSEPNPPGLPYQLTEYYPGQPGPVPVASAETRRAPRLDTPQQVRDVFNPASAPTPWTNQLTQNQSYTNPAELRPIPTTEYVLAALPPSPDLIHPQAVWHTPSIQPSWGYATPTRLTHLEGALRSLTAAGLTKEAATVRQEIVNEKQALQRRTLEAKKRELQALQAEIVALTRSSPRPEKEKESATHFRLDTLILSSTEDRLRSAGLEFSNESGFGGNSADGGQFFRLLDDGADAYYLLDRCKHASGVTIRGSANHIVLDGQRTTWQNGVEVPVPEIVPASANSKQTLSTGFRRVGTEFSFTPSLNNDGMINLQTVLEVSTFAKQNSHFIQVAGKSSPAINSRRATSQLKLRPGETTMIGVFHLDDTVTVVGVQVSIVK